MINHFKIASIAVAITLGLSACGGSDNQALINALTPPAPAPVPPAPEPTTLTGRFIDFTLEGLNYATATQSGATTTNSEFMFEDGETISFFVGDILLGTLPAAEELSIRDLLPGFIIPTAKNDVLDALNKLQAYAEGLSGSNLGPRTSTKERDKRNTEETTAETRDIESRDGPGGEGVINYPNAYNIRQAEAEDYAINLLVLLYSMDVDADTSNGVQLNEDIHALAAGKSLELLQRYQRFFFDAVFRGLMEDGYAAGVWGGTKPPTTPGNAVDGLYGTLALVPELFYETSRYYLTPDTQQPTARADGYTPQWGNNFAYDANGNMTLYEYYDSYLSEIPGDLTLMEQRIMTYSPTGRPLTYDYDRMADGIIDESQTISYDDKGNAILFERFQDETVLRALTSVGTSTISYLPTGRPTEIISSWVWNEFDDFENFEYDTAGNLTRVTRGTVGQPAFWEQLFTYDANNRVIQQEYRQYNSAGAITYTTTYTYSYDADDNLVEETYAHVNDSDGDGTPNSINTSTVLLTYDANGSLLTQEYTYSNDNNADGTPDSTGGSLYTYTYDADGNQTSSTYDNLNSTQSPDWVSTYEYDAQGNLTLYTYDQFGDGSIDSQTIYNNSYDANDNLTLVEYASNDVDGFTSATERTYTEVNKLQAPLDFFLRLFGGFRD